MKKAGGYRIGFLQFHPYEKKHLTETKQVVIKLFIHVFE